MPSSERSREERALRAAVLRGDERAWQALYDAACEPLFAYVSWRCGGLRELAEDVTQETWLVAVRRIEAFDPERAPFLGWLRGVAANVLRNRLRSRPALRTLDGDVAAPECQTFDPGDAVAHALAAIPERYEAVLRAKYLETLSVQQIAAQWRETEKAIESLLTRARQAFRAVYQPDDETAFREAP